MSISINTMTAPGKARVDVWLCDLATKDDDRSGAAAQAVTLRTRADRQIMRARAYRHLLETALSSYSGEGISALTSDPAGYADGGTFSVTAGGRRLECRLAATDRHLVLALSQEDTFGLHCADMSRRVCWSDLAARIFTRGEVSNLISVPPLAQSRRFMQIWSLKCAYFRTIGEDAAQTLESVGLSFNRSGCIRITTAMPETHLSLAQFELPDGVLISGCLPVSSVVASTFRFMHVGKDGAAQLHRPVVFRRSQPLPGRAIA